MLIKCHICKKPQYHYARGLCRYCYKVANLNGNHTQYELTPKQRRESEKHSSEWKQNEPATSARCLKCGEGKAEALGLCAPCYKRARRDGELDNIERNYFRTAEETELFVYLQRLEKRMTWKEVPA